MRDIVVGKDKISVGELIGKGGEGEVYTVNGKAGIAAKIYDARLRASREEKVRAIVGAGLAANTNLVAYPKEIVSDERGNFLGFVMRLVSGYRPLHELYSPKSRLRHFPKEDYRFIIRAALNVARAVGKVHETGSIIGDLNHSGILVAQDATVALIDADSFQFWLNGKYYPCVVAVPDFTPPELHGKKPGALVRTVEHDNFGLAVAIFHLLFMGRHPYAGRYGGPDISMAEAIAQNRFAFSLTRRSTTNTTPPPGALVLDQFPDVVGTAFERAFGLSPAARPGASDWIVALTKLEGLLNRCGKIKTHYYLQSTKDCVWCKLAIDSHFDMFPDLSAEPISTDARGTEQAIRDILEFSFPTVGDLLRQLAVSANSESRSLSEAKAGKRGRTLLGLLMIAGAIAGCIFAVSAWFVWIGLGWWGWTFVSDRKVDPSHFRRVFIEADERAQRELDSFVRRNGLAEVFKVRSDLDAAIAAYKANDNTLASELIRLSSTREARQRSAYLDQFPIRGANISGIGPAKTATLISFGIETAADVTRSAILQISGFGEVLAGKLMAWRQSHEAGFRYNPIRNDQDIADEKALRARFANEKAKLDSIIRHGLATLRSAKVRLDALPGKARSDEALVQSFGDRAQAEMDLKVLGASIPNSVVSLSFTTPPPPNPQLSNAPTVSKPLPPRSTTNAPAVTCPQCGSQMQRKSGRYGHFWGCLRYPRCRGTRKI